MNKLLKRSFSLLLILSLVISLFAGLTVVSAATSYNSGAIGVTCTSLSSQATAYYTGSYTYAKLSSQTGSTLKSSISALVTSDRSTVGYNGLKTYFPRTDAVNGSSSTLRLFYCGVKADSSWDSGTTWNREHMWPDSKGGSACEGDLHSMRPTDPTLNSTRGNNPYGDTNGGSAKYSSSTNGSVLGGYLANGVFEPLDNVKGDVARAIIYDYCTYSSLSDLSLVFTSTDVLLDWIALDPVDEFEMSRNDVIQDIQGCRNPFVDYPDLAWRVLNKTVPSDLITPAGGAGTSYTITATSSNTSYGTVSVSGNVITASPKTGYYASGYTVVSGSATVTQNGNTFTVSASSNCTIRINFSAKTTLSLKFSQNGSVVSTQSVYAGDSITLPAHSGSAPSGYSFLGWVTSSVTDSTTKPTVYAAGSSYSPTASGTLFALYSYSVGGTGSTEYVLTDIGSISATDSVVVTMTYTDGTVYALYNANGTSSAPTGTIVTVSGDKLASTPASTILWNIGGNSSGYIFYPEGTTDSWLYCTGTNNGVRVGTNTANTFVIDSASGYLKHTGTGRYVGVYRTNPDWRCYTNTTGNTANQTLGFYVKGQGGTTYYTTTTGSACSHSSTATQTVNPTCTEDGYTTVTCNSCGAVVSTTTIDALGHSYNSGVVTAPSCTTGGYTTYTCTVCGDSYQGNATSATGHSYVNGTCTVCGAAQPSAEGYEGRYYIATIRSSGNYFYMTSDLGTSSTKRYQAVDSGLTTLPSSIAEADVVAERVFVLELNSDGTYSLYAESVSGNNYLGWTSGNSGTLVAADSALALTVDYADDIYNIHFAASDAERYLALNGTSGNNYFAWYKSGQKQDLVLIPIGGSTETPDPTCQHTNTTTTTVDPTCTAAGSTTVTCDDCGETISTETIAATGHNYQYSSTVAPTATTQGYDIYICANCGDEQYRNYTDATGETFTVTFLVPEGVTAIADVECTQLTLPVPQGTPTNAPADYSFLGWVTSAVDNSATKPTTIYNTTSTYTVSSDITLYALYTYGGAATRTFTLYDGTNTIYIGDTVIIVAAAYDYAMGSTQNSNNRAAVAINRSSDGKTITTTDEAVGYFTLGWGVNGSTETSKISFKDSNGYLYAASSSGNYLRSKSTLDANGTWTLNRNTTDNTMNFVAQGTYTRNTMQYNASSNLFACYSGASQSAVQMYVLTDESAGNATYTTVFYADTTCQHTNTSTTTVDATCTTAGSVTVTCDDCGETISSETIPATGHQNTSTNTVDATCTTAGSVTVTCDDCGETLSSETIPATGHQNTSTNTVDATCTTAGSVTVTCDDCGETLSSETIVATGHQNTSTATVEATCTENGSVTVTCDDCGNVLSTEVIESTGHDYTYTDNGDTHTITCLNGCGYSVTEGHTYENGSCICGAVETVEPAEPTEVTIKIGHTVSFDSDLKMNYRIKYADIAAAVPNYTMDGAYLTIEKDRYPKGGGEMTVETVTLQPDLLSDETRVLFSLPGIQSVEMGSELRAVLHFFDADGNEYYTTVDAYSILAYAQLCFDFYDPAEDAYLFTMLIDCLNYGSAAQVAFDRRADELVNAGMDAYQQYATTELAAELTDVRTYVDNDRTITAVTAMGFSVTFADKTEINAKLTIADGYTKADITSVKVLNENGEEVATLTEFTELDDGRLQVTFTGVKSVNMRDMYYFVAYVGDQVASQNVGYSIEAYAKSNIGSSDAALAALVRNCTYYGDSAKIYFDSLLG